MLGSSAETQPSAADPPAGPRPPDGTSEDPLRAFLMRLAEFPEVRDRLIFDPVGLMSEADLTPDDQELLLSGDIDAINARVWPQGQAPRNGPLMEIEVVDSRHGPMPVVRAMQPCFVFTAQLHSQASVSAALPSIAASGFVGSVAMPYPPGFPTSIPGAPLATNPSPVASYPFPTVAPSFAGAPTDPRGWPGSVIGPGW